MPAKPITHAKWLKGLQAGFDRMSQPKGSVSRASNILWTRRGAVKVCDGTQIITNINTGLNTSLFGPITEVFLFQPTNANVAYYGIVKDPGTHLVNPSGLAAAAGAAGALTGVYKYVITALDGAGGETGPSGDATVTLTAQKGSLTWTPLANAGGGYNVYRTVAGGGAGTEKFVATVPGQASAAYTDNLPDGSLGGPYPIVNTTQVSEFFNFNAPNYSRANIINTFPADNLPFTGGGAPGGGGGSRSGGGGPSGFNPPQPAGGSAGNISPIPQILQFTNKMVLALGNGFAPYLSDGTSAGTVVINNTFTAVYPSWVASTVYTTGDQIQATVSAVAYVFTAVQGGTSGAGGAPTFPATLGATVTDNNIIWKNSGQVSGSPAPRGAAHVEVYAGSLWFANTSPTITADQLDGPSSLRMSDLNTPTSWNPLNAAQISPDDADQGAGIKAFTVAEAGIAPQNFLMYFKYFSTYLIQGVFGASNFSITRLQTDMGCIAPRSIQFVPGYGIMRLSHLGFAVTDGISDKLENPEAIRPYLFAESTENDIAPVDQSFIYFSKGAQTANPPMYVCACPLFPQVTTQTLNVTAAQGPTSFCGLTPGNYFFRILYFTASGNAIQSQELGPVAVNGTTPPLITFPPFFGIAVPAGAAKMRLYFGTTAGAENQYVVLPVSQAQFTIVANEVSGLITQLSQGFLSRIFCYDLVLKAWTVVDLPFPISVLKQFRTVGSVPITVMAGFADTALRRWQAGDVDWDAGATNVGEDTDVAWSFTDAEVSTQGATVRVFHNQIIIRGQNGEELNTTPILNGQVQQTLAAAITALGGGQFEARARVMQTVENLALKVSGNGPTLIESIDYNVEPKPVGASLVFS